MSKVEQAEPKQAEEVPADNGKPEVREEVARLVCTEILIQASHSGHYIEFDYHFSLTMTTVFALIYGTF